MFDQNKSLRELNSFRVQAFCRSYFGFEREDELVSFICENEELLKDFFILGGGTNTLFVEDFNGLVIHPRGSLIKVIKESASHIYVRAEAGCQWDDLVHYSVNRGFKGVENLTLIPGNVGASPIQNIGAYGAEVSEVIHEVRCFDLEAKSFVILNNAQCEFSYRSSVFKRKKNLIVTSVVFRLEKMNWLGIKASGRSWMEVFLESMYLARLAIKSVRIGPTTSWRIRMHFDHVRDVLNSYLLPIRLKRSMVKFIRTKTMRHPDEIGTVGCFFKSPILDANVADRLLKEFPGLISYEEGSGGIKVSGGQLIQESGAVSLNTENIYIEERRPLVILHSGQSSGRDIYLFAEEIVEKVVSKFDVRIEPEVVIVEKR